MVPRGIDLREVLQYLNLFSPRWFKLQVSFLGIVDYVRHYGNHDEWVLQGAIPALHFHKFNDTHPEENEVNCELHRF